MLIYLILNHFLDPFLENQYSLYHILLIERFNIPLTISIL